MKITKDNIGVKCGKSEPEERSAGIINFHPGGFIRPLLPWMEYEALRLAKQFNSVSWMLTIVLLRSHKFPVAVDDAYNAYRWVLEHAKGIRW